MTINGNSNPHWTLEMQDDYSIIMQRVYIYNELMSRIQETLQSFISFLQQSLVNGVLQDKMTFEDICEVIKSMEEYVQVQHSNLSLVERESASFEMLKYSNASNLEEIFPDIAENMAELLVSVQMEAEDSLKGIEETIKTCINILLN